jgi:hypothetical protein
MKQGTEGVWTRLEELTMNGKFDKTRKLALYGEWLRADRLNQALTKYFEDVAELYKEPPTPAGKEEFDERDMFDPENAFSRAEEESDDDFETGFSDEDEEVGRK